MMQGCQACTYGPHLIKLLLCLLPCCSYYFNGQGDSIKAVLKSASIVDVDGLMGQVTAGQQEVLQGMAGNFTFRCGWGLG